MITGTLHVIILRRHPSGNNTLCLNNSLEEMRDEERSQAPVPQLPKYKSEIHIIPCLPFNSL